MEAKVVHGTSRTTLLTKEHFKEMLKWEEWLYNLEYTNDVPGIPYASKATRFDPDIRFAYDEKPRAITFWDVC